jgi:glycosyltransferase involved in cell wall biosynthesis
LTYIAYLPTRYFPSISGAEFYIQRMSEIFKLKYKYKIDIFTSDAIDFNALRNPNGKRIMSDNKYFANVNNININRFPINYNSTEEEILKFLKKIPAYTTLDLTEETCLKFIKNGPCMTELLNFFLSKKPINYDLVHTTFFPYFNLIITLILGTLIKKPKLCTPFFHFSNPRYLDSSLTEVLSKFDIIIACTNLEKENLVNEFGINRGKIQVIPMGVDFEKFNNGKMNSKQKDYSFKEKFFHKGEINYKLILFCGNKNYEKGAISILKSIPYILREIKKVYFVFIGPPTLAFNRELSKVQKMDYVRIINLTPDNLTGYYDKNKLKAFKEADLYLMPSRSDAFGISFLEAWAAGKPVIGARIGATIEVIKENINGLLVEFDNPKDIAEKVIELLKKKRLRKRLGLAGKLKVLQHYTWNIIAKKTNDLYQYIINSL